MAKAQNHMQCEIKLDVVVSDQTKALRRQVIDMRQKIETRKAELGEVNRRLARFDDAEGAVEELGELQADNQSLTGIITRLELQLEKLEGEYRESQKGDTARAVRELESLADETVRTYILALRVALYARKRIKTIKAKMHRASGPASRHWNDRIWEKVNTPIKGWLQMMTNLKTYNPYKDVLEMPIEEIDHVLPQAAGEKQ